MTPVDRVPPVPEDQRPNFDQSLREFHEFIEGREFPEPELASQEGVASWMGWAWQHGYCAGASHGDPIPRLIPADVLGAALAELAARPNNHVARYMVGVLGLRIFRLTAGGPGLSDGTEAELAEVFDKIWRQIPEEGHAALEEWLEKTKQTMTRAAMEPILTP